MCVVKETLKSAACVGGRRMEGVRLFVLSAVAVCVATSLLWLVIRYVRRTADRFLLEIFMGQAQ